MNKELDIAAILRDKPKGTRLWSPIVGVCALNHINSNSDINVTIEAGIYYNGSAIYSMTFNSRGKYGGEFKDNTVERECMLFPSKEMKDWSKLAWKKGDVLTDGKRHVIFKCWDNNDYTLFFATFEYKSYDSFRQNLVLNTNEFIKSSDNVAKIVIKKVEEHYDGKLNLETLEIEKPKPQFKDGDIIYNGNAWNEYIAIFKEMPNDNHIDTYAFCYKDSKRNVSLGYWINRNDSDKLRLATESEKEQLFSALEKEGKAWDAEKKTIVDLPKKCEFNPKDWCLMRGGNEHINSDWTLCQFSHLMKCGKYRAIGGCAYNECIPYNDKTAHLLGTTDDWEGGE